MDYASEIQSRLTTKDVFLHYGFEPDRNGNICCPLHTEKTPSLKIYDGDRGWACFGCHKGGDLISFVREYFGLTFTDAISKINTDFSLGLPIGERISLRKRREMERHQKELQEERSLEQRERERLECEYWAAFDLWKKYDTNKRECAPKSPSESVNPLYSEAVKNIDYASYLLDSAEMRLKNYADKRRNNNKH